MALVARALAHVQLAGVVVVGGVDARQARVEQRRVQGVAVAVTLRGEEILMRVSSDQGTKNQNSPFQSRVPNLHYNNSVYSIPHQIDDNEFAYNE